MTKPCISDSGENDFLFNLRFLNKTTHFVRSHHISLRDCSFYNFTVLIIQFKHIDQHHDVKRMRQYSSQTTIASYFVKKSEIIMINADPKPPILQFLTWLRNEWLIALAVVEDTCTRYWGSFVMLMRCLLGSNTFRQKLVCMFSDIVGR